MVRSQEVFGGEFYEKASQLHFLVSSLNGDRRPSTPFKAVQNGREQVFGHPIAFDRASEVKMETHPLLHSPDMSLLVARITRDELKDVQLQDSTGRTIGKTHDWIPQARLQPFALVKTLVSLSSHPVWRRQYTNGHVADVATGSQEIEMHTRQVYHFESFPLRGFVHPKNHGLIFPFLINEDVFDTHTQTRVLITEIAAVPPLNFPETLIESARIGCREDYFTREYTMIHNYEPIPRSL